jgi:hypothetical protein
MRGTEGLKQKQKPSSKCVSYSVDSVRVVLLHYSSLIAVQGVYDIGFLYAGFFFFFFSLGYLTSGVVGSAAVRDGRQCLFLFDAIKI